MKIQELFYKEIDRDIKGVIKIGQYDDENIKQELEEYVVTRELKTHIDKFFTVYKKGLNGNTDKMGVWISGFFGSGKSHFLKILSYILENKKVNGMEALEYFSDKIDDNLLLADMKRASDMSSDVILFNIDSKADSDSKTSKEAIVKVFNKVFNDHLGYSGSIPWLAELEQKMDFDGHYVAFKNRFEELNGEPWITSRNDFFFIEDEFVEAYSDISGMSEDAVRNWFNKAGDHYSLSIGKFASQVQKYIESKGKNHQVVFLVDEIGQYIGDDSNLMLNLQTITEDLGTQCGGKAWIIVTSQQDIDSVVKVKGQNFSKITGRFDTRLNMSSSNVDEVIKKRLLRKKEDNGAIETLKLKYQDNESIIKNLLIFSSKTPDVKKYQSANDYADIYPFVPYQFYLLQEVFNSIRTHGASGKHLSEGERSLLSAFQESATRFKDQDLDFLMPFYAFYHTIESFLDHDVNIVIKRAMDNEALEEFDVNVLRLLFMIKYLGEKMPPNLENITTLMVDCIDVDKLSLQKQVNESLGKLHKQALIQKNGNAYVFLTNSEQDINSEIKAMNVDYSDTIKSLSSVVFDAILKADNKYQYSKEHIFTYNHKFDNDFYSSQKGELTLQVVTPAFNGGEDDDSMLKLLSMQENSVIFKLPESMSYFEEMEEALKIEAYLRKNVVRSNIPEVERIKITKGEEIRTRKERVGDLLISSLSKAIIYTHGQRLDIKEKAPETRIDEAFKTLVENKYSKINILVPFVPSSGAKSKYAELLNEKSQMTLVNSMSNKLAFDEVLAHIENMDKMHIPLTIKAITDKYAKDPYHWRSEDVRGILIRMFSMQLISLVYGSEALDRKDIEKVVDLIAKDSNLESIKIKKKVQVDKTTIDKVKSIIKETFNQGHLASDVPTLKDDIVEVLKQELRKRNHNGEELNIEAYLRQYKDGVLYPYPGKQVLQEGKAIIEKILSNHEEINFFSAIIAAEEDLFDYTEDVEDIKEFFKNKRRIFDEAVEQINNYKLSETYVTDPEAIRMINEMKDIIKMPNPYREIQHLPELRSKFILVFVELLNEESKLVEIAINSNKESTLNYLENAHISEPKKYELTSIINLRFQKLLDELEKAKVFRDAIFKKDEASKAKELLIQAIDKVEKEVTEVKPGGGGKVADPPTQVKKVKKLNLTSYAKAFKDVESDADLEDVVNKFRELLRQEMDNNDVIRFY
jgi:hypothetical protein